jgi:predicted PurR-regulated permease PerM
MSTPTDTPANALDVRTAMAVRQDLARITLAVLCLLLLVAGSLWVLRPFLGAAIWATMLVVSTWPLLVSLQQRLGGRRGPAVAVMTGAMLLLVIVPVWAAVATIVGYAGQAAVLTQKLAETGLPQPPAWVVALPLVGGKLAAAWTTLADAGPQGLAAVLRPHADDAARWVLGQAGSVGGLLVQFLLVVVLSAILYSSGETAARAVRRFGRRLAGSRGESVVVLAGQAIRGVALGVGATAVVQTVLGSLGLLVAGVPLVGLLAALMLVLCIAQMGPAPVLLAAVGWMYWRGEHTWATVLLVWAVLVQVLDNVLRPVLIKKGADLPLLLIFAGVIGGMLGFGLVGLFIGPVVLAVSYTLVAAWVEEGLGEAGGAR